MNPVFADTSYYIALLHAGDENHGKARAYTDQFDGEMVTTAWIITELGNALARGPNRGAFASLVEDLQGDPRVRIVPADSGQFEDGLSLYLHRMEKDWSLTDCVSFVVMEQMGLSNALTGDRHFEQAGFHALLR